MLIEKTARLDKAVTVEIANYVAVNKEFKLNSKFQKSVERDYKAGVEAISCEVSLENTMACGIGACLCCVEKNKEGHNVCVCTEGPVFNIEKLSWLN